MKKISAVILACSTGVAVQAQLIDDFSSLTDVADNYTYTIMLDNNGGVHNTSAYDTSTGALQLNTTSYDGIEQAALVRNGLTLGVGEEVRIDLAFSGTAGTSSRSLGLFVGGTAPVDGTRYNYLTIYTESSGTLYSRGFDGSTEYSNYNFGLQTFDQVFIARTAADTYECGWYSGGVRNVAVTRTPTTALDAQYIGIYSDVRAAGTLGTVDNLTVAAVPEPSTLAVCGLGVFGLLLTACRKK